MNQEDIILLGQLLNDMIIPDEDIIGKKYSNLIKKAKLVSEQAKASKEYQEKMDELNNELSLVGKDGEDGKNEES